MKPISCILVSLLLLTSQTRAQTPTISVEVVAINGVPLPQPLSQIVVAPGERFTMEVFLRDGSPNGEQIRAYQIEMDDKSYSSGEAGTIQPIELAAFRLIDKDNNDNAFIDTQHAGDIHGGLHCIRLTDTRNAPGYRFLSVVIDPTNAPICPQDGTKFYAGTIKMEISEDAKGTFAITFMENSESTTMMDQNSEPISPMQYEKLTVVVNSKAAKKRFVSSDPPDGAIDSRMASGSKRASWNKLQITFGSENNDIQAGDFSITDHSANPPRIRSLSASGKSITLTLDQHIRSGTWTRIKYQPTQQTISIASLPGDINGDGQRNIGDVITFENTLNGLNSNTSDKTNITGNLNMSCQDMARLIQLLSPAVRTKIPSRLKS